jgi:hypothetical protein
MANVELGLAAVAPDLGKGNGGEIYTATQGTLDETEGRVAVDVFGPESPIFQKGLFQRPVCVQGGKRLWIG